VGWLQLDPQSIADRANAANLAAGPSMVESVLRGALGFALVSVAGFAPWALAGRWFHQTVGEVGMYAACALVFIGLSGPILHRLIIGPGTVLRFYLLFGVSFLAYALGWTLAWMSIRGHLGGLIGLLVGTFAMAWIFVRAFEVPGVLVKVAAELFLGNAAGYFVGGWVVAGIVRMGTIHVFGIVLDRPTTRILAMFAWGLCYGLGFGVGLGLAFYHCQSRARALLSANEQSAS
jgi:hypothetical protein